MEGETNIGSQRAEGHQEAGLITGKLIRGRCRRRAFRPHSLEDLSKGEYWRTTRCVAHHHSLSPPVVASCRSHLDMTERRTGGSPLQAEASRGTELGTPPLRQSWPPPLRKKKFSSMEERAKQEPVALKNAQSTSSSIQWNEQNGARSEA